MGGVLGYEVPFQGQVDRFISSKEHVGWTIVTVDAVHDPPVLGLPGCALDVLFQVGFDRSVRFGQFHLEQGLPFFIRSISNLDFWIHVPVNPVTATEIVASRFHQQDGLELGVRRIW